MATYTMKQYNAAPQHKKKMKHVMVEKTLDFALTPVNDYGAHVAWAAGDIIEAIGVRAGQIFMGLTAEVVKPTTTAGDSGHTIEVLGADETQTYAWFRTGLEAPSYQGTTYLYPFYPPSSTAGMPGGLFFQPIEIPVRTTLNVKISHAFTTGIIKIVVHFLEEDRA